MQFPARLALPALLPVLLLTACDGMPPAAMIPAMSDTQTAADPQTMPPLPDWSTADLSWLANASDYSASQALCASVIEAEPPRADYPSAADAAALEGCNSAHLYFGVGEPQDRVAARQCALLERESYRQTFAQEGIEPYPLLDGSGMLATIYANGEGAQRDFDVAIHMACEMSGAPAEMLGRLDRLDEARAAGWQGSDFGPCDDITSGRAAGWCQSLQSDIAAQERAGELAAAIASWPAPQREAFDAALALFAAYAETASAMNCFGGTLAAACRIAGRQDMISIFSSRLLAFAERRALPPSPTLAEAEIDYAQAAVMTDAQWQGLVRFIQADDRDTYESHRANAIAARRAFEPRLIAFARIARPDVTAHDVRRMFRDL